MVQEVTITNKAGSEFVPAEEFAAVYTVLGSWDEAFQLLNAALDSHAEGFLSLKYAPRFNPLRSDPRFAELLAKANLDPTGKWK